jgi:hypothetical protein
MLLAPGINVCFRALISLALFSLKRLFYEHGFDFELKFGVNMIEQETQVA